MSNKAVQDKSRWSVKEWSQKPFFWVVVLSTVVLVAGAALVAVVVNRNHAKDMAQTTKVQKAQNEAYRLSAVGKYKEAYAKLRPIESKVSGKSQKVKFYTDVAAAAANSNDMGAALIYLEKKHRIDPQTAGADGYLVGSYYERNGDIAKAIINYEAALAYAQQYTKDDTVTIEALKSRIASLKGQE